MLTCTPAVVISWNIGVNMGLELYTTLGIKGVFICIAKRVNIVSNCIRFCLYQSRGNDFQDVKIER